MRSTPAGSSGGPAGGRSPASDTSSSAAPGGGGRSPDSLRAGDRVGEYVLEERVGQGGFGTVWRARHAVLPGKIVAVKIPRDPELVELLRRESILQHGLNHPGVLKVLGVNLDADVPYLVEEYAPGGDLAALLRREGKLTVEKTLELFEEMVTILAHAHKRGVVHGDLKPGNILLDDRGCVRVGDFGLGRGLEALTASALRESIESLGPFTDRRVLGGTWEYMAPEQRAAATSEEATNESDARADVYSLGVMLYEMLRGERPAGRVGLEDISPTLDEVFARCFTSLDRRYRDAGELLKALRRRRSRAGRESRRAREKAFRGKRGDHEPLTRQMSTLGSTILQRAFFLVPFVLVVATLVFVALQEEGSAPEAADREEAAFNRLPEILRSESDEALRLGGIRRWVESQPRDISGALDRLNAYLATVRDPALLKAALRWRNAIEGSSSEREYEVRWRRFRIHRETYDKRFGHEPGQPDAYLRLYRTREGKENLVFDSSSAPFEAWGHYWPEETEMPTFSISWKQGDGLRLELRDSDVLRDDTVAQYQIPDGLSILLVSSPQISPDGHVVELDCSFEFGK